MNKREIMPLRWEENPNNRLGDGISRPMPKARTREFQLIVYSQGARPMHWTTRAETKTHAMKCAQARWPGAIVEVA